MGSEMCIRDRVKAMEFSLGQPKCHFRLPWFAQVMDDGKVSINGCLLYTSDAADERSSVDLGGRRIIKKKKKEPRG